MTSYCSTRCIYTIYVHNRPLTLLRLAAVQGVDEHVGVHHITSGHPLKRPHTRSSYRSVRSNTYPLWKRWDSASRSASPRKPSRASAAPAPASPLPSPSSSKPSSIRRNNSASEIPSSLALAFSARSCSSLMYNCFLTTYTSYTSQDTVPSQPRYLLHPSHPVLHDPGKGRAVRGVAELAAPRNGDDVAGGVHHFAREMCRSPARAQSYLLLAWPGS